MKNLTLLLFMISLGAKSFAADFSLSENSLFELINNNPPSIQKIEASFLSVDVNRAQANDQFAPTLEASTNVVDSDEKSLSSFVPVTQKYKSFSVLATKPLKYGVAVGAKYFTEKSTNNFLSNATTNGYGVSLSVDLYKDLFGRTSRANLELTENSSQRAQLEKEIQIAGFKNNIRKIYWSLVANKEALRISKVLLASSEKQLKNALRRFRSGVADKGEVARYRSQISSRKAGLISIKWDESQLQHQLKLLLPELSKSSLTLSAYNIDETVSKVLACSAKIKKFTDAPMDYTKYDEVVALLTSENVSKEKIVGNYNKMDLKLLGDYESTGKAFSQSDAFDDLKDDGRSKVSVGLQLVIPLGSTKKETRVIQEKIVRDTYLSAKKENLGRVHTYHSQTVKSVDLLNEIVFNQKENTKHLKESLKTTTRKYNQARITAQQLVQEQDAYLQSNLDEISTKLAVISLLLDYFNVFTETPCGLNRTL